MSNPIFDGPSSLIDPIMAPGRSPARLHTCNEGEKPFNYNSTKLPLGENRPSQSSLSRFSSCEPASQVSCRKHCNAPRWQELACLLMVSLCCLHKWPVQCGLGSFCHGQEKKHTPPPCRISFYLITSRFR